MKKQAIRIDPTRRVVEAITVDGIEEMYRAMQCETFAAPYVMDNEDTLYADDEGLVNGHWGPNDFFQIDGYPEPMIGIALVLGANEEGESVDARSTVEDIRARVTFMDIAAVRAMAAAERSHETYPDR